MNYAHEFALKEETETDVVFECSKCGMPVGFNKPGIGEPAPTKDDLGAWQPPPDWHIYIDPCEVA